MNILLTGAYSQGNFGDDLMAVIFARFLKSEGYTVGIIPSPHHLKKETDCHFFNYQDAIRWADFVVVGGGGFLISYGSQNQTAHNILHEVALCLEYAQEQNIPVAMISVGGDGKTDTKSLSASQLKMLASPALLGVTTRLKTDLQIVSGYKFKRAYFKDIVFLTSEFFPLPKTSFSGQKSIGFNVFRDCLSFSTRCKLILQALIHDNIIFIRTHPSNYNKNYEYHPRLIAKNSCMSYEGCPKRFLENIQALGLLFSSKLHVGVACLSYGIPFMPAFSSGKTMAMFLELPISVTATNVNNLDNLFLGSDWRYTRALPENIPVILEEAKMSAKGHLDFLRELIVLVQQRK